MENILVTGYAGYIGSQICKTLKRAGYGVIGVDRTEPDDWDTYAKYVDHQYEWDYSDTRTQRILAQHKIKTVIHTAASSLVGPSMKDPSTYYTNNVDNMHTFMRLLKQSDVERIIFSSSAAVYGDRTNGTLFSEKDTCNPISPYGRTKLAGEWLIDDFSYLGGLTGIALRYFNVCGADLDGEFGQRTKPSHLISVGMTRAIAGQPITINGNNFDTTDGTCVRDYIHVQDVANANLAAITAPVGGFFAVNIGNGQGYSNLEIVDAINQYSKYKLAHDFGPARAGDPAQLVSDNSLAAVVLDWKPEYSDLETIVKTAEAWHERNTVSKP